MMHAVIEADYLATFLQPLEHRLYAPDTTDLYVNRAGEAWVERTGGTIERVAIPALTEDWLWQLAHQMARASHQGISRAEPLLSASLPCGTRVQVVAPPATRDGFAIAFRRQTQSHALLADLAQGALFEGMTMTPAPGDEADLARHYAADDHIAFLSAAVRARKTIVVSGGTASGKTTLVNALVGEYPPHERLVAIEDSAELDAGPRQCRRAIASRGETGEARVDADDLLQASLRLRPDRILLGEVRGGEALTFLRAVNTGIRIDHHHPRRQPGARALDQLAMLALQSGARIDRGDLAAYIARSVDIVVQI
ncbi:ATPase, T2SS/T4P/T4SS family [Sphingomonas sp. MMS24-JH45]